METGWVWVLFGNLGVAVYVWKWNYGLVRSMSILSVKVWSTVRVSFC